MHFYSLVIRVLLFLIEVIVCKLVVLRFYEYKFRYVVYCANKKYLSVHGNIERDNSLIAQLEGQLFQVWEVSDLILGDYVIPRMVLM